MVFSSVAWDDFKVYQIIVNYILLIINYLLLLLLLIIYKYDMKTVYCVTEFMTRIKRFWMSLSFVLSHSSFSISPIWGLVEDEKKMNKSPLPMFSFVLVFYGPDCSSSEPVFLQLQTVLHPNWTHYSSCSVDTSFNLELPPSCPYCLHFSWSLLFFRSQIAVYFFRGTSLTSQHMD